MAEYPDSAARALRDELVALLGAAPAGTQPKLSLAETRRMAAVAGCSLAQVELDALALHILPLRYERNLGTAGWEGQMRLLRATVAVVGAGGLGGWIIEGLARMGVGHLILIDGDSYSENNLNRQLGCTEETLGLPKAEVMARRVVQVSPSTRVSAQVAWLDAGNAATLLAEAEVVVDALDSLPTRFVLQRASAALGLPLVHGAVAGYTGQVMTILPGDRGLEALYGGLDALPVRGIETHLGNPAATPMLVAAWQVQEVVKLLLGQGVPIRNRLLVLDAEYGEVTEIQLAPSLDNPV